MAILVVDDFEDARLLLDRILKGGGLKDVILAESASAAFDFLGLGHGQGQAEQIDLVLMDLVMPGVDGIEALERIKSDSSLRDIPIIMVTAQDEVESLKTALESGALDYITKPVNKIELLARVRSGLKLKQETDRRKENEKNLMAMNQTLQRLSFLDGLTGIANRRYFDQLLDQEWKRAARETDPLSLIMIDIDYFKLYNDTYGHQQGDSCLKRLATLLRNSLVRPADFVARYGGEEFAAVLPNTKLGGAIAVSETMRKRLTLDSIPHTSSKVSNIVTVSMGVGSWIPDRGSEPIEFIEAVDQALYMAKGAGRNCVKKIDRFIGINGNP